MTEQLLVLLKRGVKHWNAWRQINPNFHPDLSQASLHALILRGGNLQFVTLDRAQLCEADLIEADFRHATLIDANLSGAHLYGTNFGQSQLRGANLLNASLSAANFNSADLGTGSVV